MREGPCNKGRMLKKFPTKFKYSIAIYTLNVYKTYITLLQKTKSVKIIKQDFSDFLSNQYKIMMTDCRILYRNEETLS